MSKVLYLQASPRAGRSHARAVADAFIEAYGGANPNDEIKTVDLFRAEIPAFDGLAVQAKYTILHGKEHTPEELEAWRAVEALIEEFTSADKYVLAVPMWNFGIPYRLKQYLDNLIQPGYTFSFSPEEGYAGLVTGKPAFIAYARGGEHSDGPTAAMDHQKSYLEMILGFIGITDIRSVVVEPTLMGGPDMAKERRADAVAQAVEIAANF